jgi:hypothetical protein
LVRGGGDFRLHVVAGGRVEDARVADVGAVEVAEEVDEGREGEDGEVLVVEKGAVFGGGVAEVGGGGGGGGGAG